jgi:Tfp pilus assembly protein PilO
MQENELLSKRSMELNAAETSLNSLRNALKVKRERIKVMNKQIPQSGDIGFFLKQLNALTEKNAIGLVSIRPMPPLQEKFYIRVPVQLICKGSFQSIFKLLRELEDMDSRLMLEKMAISRSENHQECGLELITTILQYKQG